MAHIHTGDAQHDSTISAFIFHEGRNAVLMHRHRVLGILIQPGGHIELSEHPWATMDHELQEETGYELSQLQVLQAAPQIPGLVEVIHPIPLTVRTHDFPGTTAAHFHTDLAYGFVTNEDPSGTPAEGESEEIYWLTAAEIRAIPDGQIPPDARTIALHVLENVNSYHRIPANQFEV